MYTLVPACIMLVTTIAAFVYQLYGALTRVDGNGAQNPDWLIAAVVSVLIALALVVFWEGVSVLTNSTRAEGMATAGGGKS
jgi:hypothetical protein